MKALVLLDIDGTILLTGGAGGRAMIRAGVHLHGAAFCWDGIDPAGALDPQLYRDAVAASGLEYRESDHARFRERYFEMLAIELDGARHRDEIVTMPGIRALIEGLAARRDVELGILTGNYEPSARMKLAAAGIDAAHFAFTASGDHADSRAGLVRWALDRIAETRGAPLSPERVVVVGDTARDVECALANGCLAFAVATGSTSVERLRDAGAHHVVEDLADASPLHALLDAMH